MDRPHDPRRRGVRHCRLSARRRGAADSSSSTGRAPRSIIYSRPSRRSPATAAPIDAAACRIPRSERLLFWAGRKAAFPAVGRISPDYYCMDGTIPRAHAAAGARAHRARCRRNTACAVANVFHAGDGNLHPLILYDANQPGELERAEAFGADILRLCVEVGGVLTGEHGVGVEKRDLMPAMFSEADLDAAAARSNARSTPKGLLNPGKVFPTLHRCAELGRMHVSRRQGAVSGYSAVLTRAISTAVVAEPAGRVVRDCLRIRPYGNLNPKQQGRKDVFIGVADDANATARQSRRKSTIFDTGKATRAHRASNPMPEGGKDTAARSRATAGVRAEAGDHAPIRKVGTRFSRNKKKR